MIEELVHILRIVGWYGRVVGNGLDARGYTPAIVALGAGRDEGLAVDGGVKTSGHI